MLLLPLLLGARAMTPTAEVSPAGALDGNDGYGYDVAVTHGFSEHHALVCANFGGSVSGAAYAFSSADDGSSWTLEQVLQDGSGASRRYCESVAIDGAFAAVGCESCDEGTTDGGSVHLYVLDGASKSWNSTGIVTASDAASGDEFGEAVAVSGDILVVGSPDNAQVASRAGAAYFFRVVSNGLTWDEKAKVVAPDGATDDTFGKAVTVAGSIAAIGSPAVGSANGGAVYVYTTADGGDNWALQQTLTSTGATTFQFGHHVALYGNVLMATAATANFGAGGESGGVLVFLTSDGGGSWSLTETLTASDGAFQDRFGSDVALFGDYVVVGASRDDSSAGSAYVFATSDSGVSWTESSKITASPSASDEEFGFAVALHDGVAVIGAPKDDDQGTNAGTAYSALIASVGSFGDPVFVDFAGHRFLSGDKPLESYELFSFDGDRFLLTTGTARGREGGFFVESVALEREGVGIVRAEVVPGRRAVSVSGDDAMLHTVAQGDSGVTILAVDNGAAIVLVGPHVASDDYSFLNVKVLFATEELKAACSGLLCEETHV